SEAVCTANGVHTQVSPSAVVALAAPPKRTTCPVAGSSAIAAPYRAGLTTAVGVCKTQFVPLQAQVSLRPPPVCRFAPASSSICPVAESKARAGKLRATGLLAGLSLDHVVPVQLQVSPKKPEPIVPPNRSSCFEAGSYPM